MTGGLIFLLSLVFAAATGGGLVAFIIASIVLNIARGIVRSATGQRRRQQQAQPPVEQPPQTQENEWNWQEFWEKLQQRFKDLENWDGTWEPRGERERRRNQRPRRNPSEPDDRFARNRQPSTRSTTRQNQTRAAASSTRTTSTQRVATPTNRPEVYTHASEAVRRAGLNPENAGLALSDIGLIVYGTEPRPVVHRESAVPETANYIQPFAELKAARAAKGRLTFEVLDSAGQVVYRREEEQQLRSGKTGVLPRTRLPIGDHFDLKQGWTLNIYANDVLLATHPFGWYDPADRTETLREVMSNDGELTADLSALMDDIQSQPMSLDDLLGGDSTASQAQARR